MARTDDDDFMFLNEEENEVEDIPEVLAAKPREVRVNGKGQKVRGKDLEWIPRSSFIQEEWAMLDVQKSSESFIHLTAMMYM